MRFYYYDRLSSQEKKVYLESDAITTVKLPRATRVVRHVRAVERALRRGRQREVEPAARRLVAATLENLGVPPVRLRVLSRRPTHDWGELQGLYEPAEGRRRARITVWMRTAQRKQIVAFRTFLRTIIHEILHHLDYELFDLEESFHTGGFFRRESSLFRQLVRKR